MQDEHDKHQFLYDYMLIRVFMVIFKNQISTAK